MKEQNEKETVEIIKALDALSLALTAHDHKWTKKQRSLYEKAIHFLNFRRSAFKNAALNLAFASIQGAAFTKAASQNRTIR